VVHRRQAVNRLRNSPYSLFLKERHTTEFLKLIHMDNLSTLHQLLSSVLKVEDRLMVDPMQGLLLLHFPQEVVKALIMTILIPPLGNTLSRKPRLKAIRERKQNTNLEETVMECKLSWNKLLEEEPVS